MKEQFNNLEQEQLKSFQELREKVHEQIDAETEARIKSNPQPTELEILAGAFREMIEPQVRDAVFEFYRKGYATASSGFGGEWGEIQVIDGHFEVDRDTKAKIEELGAKVLKGTDVVPSFEETYTFIKFKPEKSDLNEIKAKWDKIAQALPARDEPAPPSISGGPEDFRKQYAPDRTDIEKAMLERRLLLTESHPDVEEEMRQRIKELSK